MAHTLWFTHPATGLVEVDGVVPSLGDAGARVFESDVRRWEALSCEAAHEFGVPVHWILGMMLAESGGVISARSPVGAIGLMQIHSAGARAGLSDEELLDPATNIRAGARLISLIYRDGDQLPEVASKYNAGGGLDGSPHPSERSPWRMREDPGHIDRVVAAANYAAETSTRCQTQAFPDRQVTPAGPLRPSSPTPAPASRAGLTTADAGIGALAFGWLAWELFGKRRGARARRRA